MKKTPKILRLCVLLPLVGAMGIVQGCGDDDTNAPGGIDAGLDVAADATPDTSPPTEAGKDAAVEADAAPHLILGNVDRAGRAAIIEALIQAPDKNGYNLGDTFTFIGVGAIDGNHISADFQRSLVTLDRVDGVEDWDGGSPDGSPTEVPVDAGPDADGGTMLVTVYTHPLVPLLKADLLLVDTSRPFSPTGYLDIEYTTMTGNPGTHTTCGGRWLADDSVDKTMSFFVKKSLTGVSDGVSKATKDPALTFPYLAPPN